MSPQPRNDDASKLEEEEEEVRKLEEEVERIAQRALDYRNTLPDQLTSTLASLLASQRPVLPTHLDENGSDPGSGEAGTSRPENMDLVVSQEAAEEAEKIQLIKQKISSNAAKMPIALKRMKEYIARIEKFESTNGIIHPAFKRKRPC